MTSHSQCRSVHCFLFLSSPEGSQVLGSWNKETRAHNRVRETAVAAVCNCLVSEGIQCSYLICTLGYALMRLLFLGAFRWVFILVTRIPPGMTSWRRTHIVDLCTASCSLIYLLFSVCSLPAVPLCGKPVGTDPAPRVSIPEAAPGPCTGESECKGLFTPRLAAETATLYWLRWPTRICTAETGQRRQNDWDRFPRCLRFQRALAKAKQQASVWKGLKYRVQKGIASQVYVILNK